MIGDREFRIYLDRVRDGAVAAVMRLGRFERSGDVRLTVLRLEKVMIAYRTPFNPLPPFERSSEIRGRAGGEVRPSGTLRN